MKGSTSVIIIFVVLILAAAAFGFIVKRMKDASASATLNAT